MTYPGDFFRLRFLQLSLVRWTFLHSAALYLLKMDLSCKGALATLVASYLARARGSNEPELSIARTKDLEQFIRQCEILQMDHGHEMGDKFDKELAQLRARFEELLGNTG